MWPRRSRGGQLDGQESVAKILGYTRALLVQIRRPFPERDPKRTRRVAVATVQSHVDRGIEEAEHSEAQRRRHYLDTEGSADSGHSRDRDRQPDYD